MKTYSAFKFIISYIPELRSIFSTVMWVSRVSWCDIFQIQKVFFWLILTICVLLGAEGLNCFSIIPALHINSASLGSRWRLFWSIPTPQAYGVMVLFFCPSVVVAVAWGVSLTYSGRSQPQVHSPSPCLSGCIVLCHCFFAWLLIPRPVNMIQLGVYHPPSSLFRLIVFCS